MGKSSRAAGTSMVFSTAPHIQCWPKMCHGAAEMEYDTAVLNCILQVNVWCLNASCHTELVKSVNGWRINSSAQTTYTCQYKHISSDALAISLKEAVKTENRTLCPGYHRPLHC